jgi:DNA-binding Lrp family transcriptional regulator
MSTSGKIKKKIEKKPKKKKNNINVIDADLKFYMDDTDSKIINILINNGRMNNNQIAEKLGIGEATVRRRIDKLVQGGIIRSFTVLLDYKKLGNSLKATIHLKISGSNLDKVASFLKKIKYSCGVYRVIGKYNLYAEIISENIQEFQTLIDILTEMENIEEVEYQIVTHSYKSCPWTGI